MDACKIVENVPKEKVNQPQSDERTNGASQNPPLLPFSIAHKFRHAPHPVPCRLPNTTGCEERTKKKEREDADLVFRLAPPAWPHFLPFYLHIPSQRTTPPTRGQRTALLDLHLVLAQAVLLMSGLYPKGGRSGQTKSRTIIHTEGFTPYLISNPPKSKEATRTSCRRSRTWCGGRRA